METVIVTGAAGFIGSKLTEELLAEGYRVIGIDNFDDTYDPALKEGNVAPFLSNDNFVLERADIRDAGAMLEIFKREKPVYVIHLAAKADTRNAVNDPRIYISTNIDGTLNLLEAAREVGTVKKFVLASSSSVYGNDENVPWTEDSLADRPLSPYGATKRATEHLAHTYHHNFGMPIVCLRYFNVYGENNRPGMVPYKWAEKLLKGEEIEISGDGSRSRDYTYIDDTVRGTILAMKSDIDFDVINVGNSSPLSLNELVQAFERVLGITAKVKSRPSHPASVESTYADVSKAKRLLGWEPQMPFDEGLTRFVAWFKENRLK